MNGSQKIGQRPDGNVTKAIASVDETYGESSHELWNHFFERLCQYAQTKVFRRHQRLIDSEALAASALHALLDGMRHGRFDDVNNRDDLWQMLALVTARKASNARRYYDQEKRGGGNVRGDSVFSALAASGVNGRSGGDDPADLIEVESTCSKLLEQLPDAKYRSVAMLRLSGYSSDDIARQLKCSRRTIERKLRVIGDMLERLIKC